jgi:hypothetical protein
LIVIATKQVNLIGGPKKRKIPFIPNSKLQRTQRKKKKSKVSYVNLNLSLGASRSHSKICPFERKKKLKKRACRAVAIGLKQERSKTP